jgi:acid stress-induced BolA-like protein IbaG/YrbA
MEKMMTADELRNHIVNGLPCDHAQVLGDDGQHFEAVIVSPQFAGQSRVQQHQRVYQALGDRMRSEIHALSLRTFTPEAWAQTTRE